MSFGAGRVVPRPDQGRQGAGAGGQFRQCQCVHRQERPRGLRLHRQARGERRRLQDDGSVSRLDRRDRRAAAGAIMTTDTFPKLATASARLGGTTVTINGFAKGAGMIAPDMATMLAFVFTDAPIAAPALQALLRDGVVDTFNAVTIDGDTSTSDTLLAFATGAAEARGAPRIARATDPR